MKSKVLLVDDSEPIRETLSGLLDDLYDLTTATDGESGLKLMRRQEFAAAIVELKLPGMDGIEFIKKAAKASPRTASIVLTEHATVDSAVKAMSEGAFNYISKPFRTEDMLLHIKRAVEFNSLSSENSKLKAEAGKEYSFDKIVGDSAQIQAIFDLIGKVADTDSSILVLGESGTGKELIARTIHYNSTRASEPFIPINCGAIPTELIESELFGHEKGAFTGAVASRAGRFERAHMGTIFLDEIGELAFPLQVKLLRVLQEREFERVGGTKTIEVDVRVIAATNINLEESVKEKRFREDLYYRLNVIPVVIPPLRDRDGDIPLLARHFLDIMIEKKEREVTGFTDEAMTLLKNYPWPGNIRELENIIERMVILKSGEGQLDVVDVPEKVSGLQVQGRSQMDIPDQGIDLPALLEEMERGLILKAVEKSGGVKSKAAALLGINRTTLIEKMKKKGIKVKEKKSA